MVLGSLLIKRLTINIFLSAISASSLLSLLLASPPLADRNDGEGRVLHYKSQLHIYHIGSISLLSICEESDCHQTHRKARAVHQQVPFRGFRGLKVSLRSYGHEKALFLGHEQQIQRI